ncbi:MAG: GGDEF domain-containing protein [Proteiniphilum sp.]|nr:GGDEF domain-containing protein [Proteiniphilum sp.]
MRNLKDKSSILTIIAVLILALSLSGSLATIYITRTINSDAETINKLGIIRGSIQKLIKLEMCEVESDKLIEDIESRIDEFENNKAHTYDENEMIKNSIDELTSTWLLLKEAIINYRSKPYANNQDKVLQLSEDIWMKSNNMVYSSQIVSENKIDRYNISYFFLAINLLLGLSIIFLIRRYVKKSLERLVNYDELTAIYNRRYFNESLANEILKAERYDRDFSLIFFDIDHFKKVNDTYGHEMMMDVSQVHISV